MVRVQFPKLEGSAVTGEVETHHPYPPSQIPESPIPSEARQSVTYLAVDESRQINIEVLKQSLNDSTALGSVP